MNYFRRLRDAAISVALLAFPFFVLSANLKDPADTNAVDRLVLQASAPIQYVATEVAHSVSGVLEEYVFLIDVKHDNDRLRRDIARLHEENRRLRVQARENQRLRELLQLRERLGGETITARVIAKDISNHFRVVRVVLDRGDRDQVRPGMPVVSADGLVGQIQRSWGRYSDVLLTVDRTSAIDVQVPRTGARGVLRGTGESDRYRAHIEYLERTDEVQVGDEVYTSGLGQRFPASILAGTITRVDRKDFGLYQQVEVSPAVRFSNLEEVLILTQGSRRSGVAGGDPDLRGEESP